MSNHKATLVSGRQYTQMFPNPQDPRNPLTLTFKRGETQTVTDDQKKVLEAAMDTVSVKRGNETQNEERAKFSFEVVKGRPASAKTPE